MDFNPILEMIKAIGAKPVMEIAKNKWVQFCIGVAILMLSAPPLINAIRWW